MKHKPAILSYCLAGTSMSSHSKMHQGHKARKRFGQNFLVDPEMVVNIAQSIEPQPQDHIIEIGPGLGAITDELVASGAKVTLIELDRDLITKLQNRYATQIQKNQVKIISADVLKVDFLQVMLPEHPQAKLIGNLPYNISTPVLFHILNFRTQFEMMTFMLQKEVVNRMSAAAKTSAYSALSVILQLECEIEKLFDVPPESFQPPPKVDSAVVQLRPKSTLLLSNELEDQLIAFRKFVHTCFQQRRKTLRNNLKGTLEVTAIEDSGINPQDRPEHLSLQDYVKLFKVYWSQTNP